MKLKYKLILFVVTSTLSLSASNNRDVNPTREEGTVRPSVNLPIGSPDCDQPMQSTVDWDRYKK